MSRSRGGLTSKIHAVVDTNGLLVRLALTAGEAHDSRLAGKLLSRLKSGTMLLADRGAAGFSTFGLFFRNRIVARLGLLVDRQDLPQRSACERDLLPRGMVRQRGRGGGNLARPRKQRRPCGPAAGHEIVLVAR
jgi:transposase